MTPERFRGLRALFEAALDKPAADRREWLREACNGDEQLLAAVEDLLRADELAERGVVLAGPSFLAQDRTEVQVGAGARIGQYRSSMRSAVAAWASSISLDGQTTPSRNKLRSRFSGAKGPIPSCCDAFSTSVKSSLGWTTRTSRGSSTAAQPPMASPTLVMEYIVGQPIDAYCDDAEARRLGAASTDPHGLCRGPIRAHAPHRSPRPEAVEHPGDGRWHGEAAGLRYRQDAG